MEMVSLVRFVGVNWIQYWKWKSCL